MKSLLVTLCVVAYISSVAADDRPPIIDKFFEDLAACKTKVGATEDDTKAVIGSQKLTTKPAQCLMACINKKTGVMGADNKMDIVKGKAALELIKSQNEEMYNKMCKAFDTCKQQETPEADECVAAKKFSDCMVEQGNKNKP